jgi:RNA-directed DNA polymerase
MLLRRSHFGVFAFFLHMRKLNELSEILEVRKDFLLDRLPDYEKFFVRKKKRGRREIHAPSEFTKLVQTQICRNLLPSYESHSRCFGFEPGKSIYDNAKIHVGKNVLVNLDIKDFFPNTTSKRIHEFFSREWDEESCSVLLKWVTLDGALPQGSPASPRLTNILNLGLDEILYSLSLTYDFNFSRYADDISFSSMEGSREIVDNLISCAIKSVGLFGYEIHPDKLKVLRRNRRMTVTGLVVNDKVSIPKKTRKWLRAVMHRKDTGGTPTINDEELNGWLALCNMVTE